MGSDGRRLPFGQERWYEREFPHDGSDPRRRRGRHDGGHFAALVPATQCPERGGQASELKMQQAKSLAEGASRRQFCRVVGHGFTYGRVCRVCARL